MNKTLIYLAAGLGLLWFMRRRSAGGSDTLARVGGLAETGIVDGTNWTGNLWDTLQTAADFRDPYAPNLTGSANADPGTVGQNLLGLKPGWDGSL